MITTVPPEADEFISFRATPIEEEELDEIKEEKVFCPTGPGGGRDATCSPKRGGRAATQQEWHDSLTAEEKEVTEKWTWSWKDIREKQVKGPLKLDYQTSEEFANKHAEITNRIFSKKGDPELKVGDEIGEVIGARVNLPPETRVLKIIPPQFPKFDPNPVIIYHKIPDEKDDQKFEEEKKKVERLNDYYEKTVGAWESALDKAPVHSGVAYRGLLHSDLDKFQVGSTFKMNSDSSSTKLESTGAQFATRSASASSDPGEDEASFETGNGVLLEIKTKTAADVSILSTLSKRPEEEEVILRRGTEYRVVEVRHRAGKTSHGSYDKVLVEEI